MKIQPNDPVYPAIELQELNAGIGHYTTSLGMPIRLEIAKTILPVIIDSNKEEFNPNINANLALKYADALISEYNRTEP